MADFVVDEIRTLFVTIGIGAALAVVYDVFRIARRVVKHNIVAVSGEDVIFWMVAGFATYYFFLFINDGKFRVYMVAGIILGIFSYRMTLSRIFVPFFSKILRKFVEICIKLLKKAVNSFKIKSIFKKCGNNKTRGGNIEKKSRRPGS